jgi:hypothetical protein
MPDLVAFESTSLAADGAAVAGAFLITGLTAGPALLSVPVMAIVGAVFLTVRDFTPTTLAVDDL